MKLWVLSLSLLLCRAVAGANWYVDNAATGANRGTSWANAWTNFAAIDWGPIGPGDTVYISGGSPSKTYDGQLTIGKSGTSGKPLTIRVGQEPSHNGIAILNGSHIEAGGKQFVTISGEVGGKPHLALWNFFSTKERTWGNKIVADGTTGFVLEYTASSNVNQVVSLIGATRFNVQHNVGTDIRGDAAVRAVNCSGNAFDVNFVQNNFFELSRYVGPDPSLIGPDGVQGSHGLTIRNNVFTVKNVSYHTSSQHPDYCQVIGNYLKICGNEFVNIGDSGIDLDWWANPTPHDILIFNNVFRITGKYDPYPEFIRFYASAGKSISTITNFKIFNNDFIDNNGWASILGSWGASGNPTLSGVEICNNLFINSSPYSIADNPRLSQNPIVFANNVYSPGVTMSYRGATFSARSWHRVEPTRTVGMPAFARYSPHSPSNDLHLLPSDTVARGKALHQDGLCTTDKDGQSRTGEWDAGAFQCASPKKTSF